MSYRDDIREKIEEHRREIRLLEKRLEQDSIGRNLERLHLSGIEAREEYIQGRVIIIPGDDDSMERLESVLVYAEEAIGWEE